MDRNKISFFSGSLLWFGAAISIAEILTGVLLAPLGFRLGLSAILAGHLIGCILFYFAGLIGAKSNLSAMESVQLSFGRYGSVFFSILNILQLIGWTAVMIFSGGEALGSILNVNPNLSGNILWCIVIGVFVLIWITAGLKNLGKVNNIAVILLLALSAVLGVIVFRGGSSQSVEGSMTFGLALELSVAMPISWLPLVSDYTKHTDRPISFTMVNTLSYFFGSCFMYAIGLGAALFSGSTDVIAILTGAGLGAAAMVIVVLATATTTFLDVYSAGESMLHIFPKWNGKTTGIVICLVGTLIAIFVPIVRYQDFLYLIGSVFVPMAAILITDYFILRKRNRNSNYDTLNLILWAVGFLVYRFFLGIDTLLGSTVPVVVIVMLLCITVNFIRKKVFRNV